LRFLEKKFRSFEEKNFRNFEGKNLKNKTTTHLKEIDSLNNISKKEFQKNSHTIDKIKKKLSNKLNCFIYIIKMI
jgi:hypothetical protein